MVIGVVLWHESTCIYNFFDEVWWTSGGHNYPSLILSLTRYPGTSTRCLNLGSYNYLGFAESTGPCADAAMEATYKYGAGCCSMRRDLGRLSLYWGNIRALLGVMVYEGPTHFSDDNYYSKPLKCSTINVTVHGYSLGVYMHIQN